MDQTNDGWGPTVSGTDSSAVTPSPAVATPPTDTSTDKASAQPGMLAYVNSLMSNGVNSTDAMKMAMRIPTYANSKFSFSPSADGKSFVDNSTASAGGSGSDGWGPSVPAHEVAPSNNSTVNPPTLGAKISGTAIQAYQEQMADAKQAMKGNAADLPVIAKTAMDTIKQDVSNNFSGKNLPQRYMTPQEADAAKALGYISGNDAAVFQTMAPAGQKHPTLNLPDKGNWLGQLLTESAPANIAKGMFTATQQERVKYDRIQTYIKQSAILADPKASPEDKAQAQANLDLLKEPSESLKGDFDIIAKSFNKNPTATVKALGEGIFKSIRVDPELLLIGGGSSGVTALSDAAKAAGASAKTITALKILEHTVTGAGQGAGLNAGIAAAKGVGSPTGIAAPGSVQTAAEQGAAIGAVLGAARSPKERAQPETLTPDTDSPGWSKPVAGNEVGPVNPTGGNPPSGGQGKYTATVIPPDRLTTDHVSPEQSGTAQLRLGKSGDVNAPHEPGQPIATNTPIDDTGTIPLTGGTSEDLKGLHVDKDFPSTKELTNQAGQKVTLPVKDIVTQVHEAEEAPLMHPQGPVPIDKIHDLMDRAGSFATAKVFSPTILKDIADGTPLSYSDAHNIATAIENHHVESNYNVDHKVYQDSLLPDIKQIQKRAEGEPASDIPATLGNKPYDDSGLGDQVEGQSKPSVGGLPAGDEEGWGKPVENNASGESSASPVVKDWAMQKFNGDSEIADNFGKWFGDSKVTDTSGNPIVVYHGTSDNFKEFGNSPSPYTGYSYIGPELNLVQIKHRMVDIYSAALEKQANAIMSSIKGGSSFKDAMEEHGSIALADAFGGHMTPNNISNKGMFFFAKSPKVANTYADSTLKTSGQNVIPAYLSIKNPLIVDAKGNDWRYTTHASINKAARNGHDGLIVHNVIDDLRGEGKPSTVYVAFNPEQIKSATGNSGKFGRGVPDMTGKIDPKLLKALGVGAAGALAGAYLYQKHPVKGAMIGATAAMMLAGSHPLKFLAALRDATSGNKKINISSFLDARDGMMADSSRARVQAQDHLSKIIPSKQERVNVDNHLDDPKRYPNVTPAEKKAASYIRNVYDSLGKTAMQHGVLDAMIKDYNSRRWQQTPQTDSILQQILAAKQKASPTGTTSTHNINRVFVTKAEGIAAGLKPVTEDAIENMGMYWDSMTRTIANKITLDSLKNGKIPHSSDTLIMPLGKAPVSYVANARLPGVLIHPDIAQQLAQVYYLKDVNPFVRGLSAINTLQKRTAVMASAFHAVSLAQAHFSANSVFHPINNTRDILTSLLGKSEAHKTLMTGGPGDELGGLLRAGMKVQLPQGDGIDIDYNQDYYPALEKAQNYLNGVLPGSGKIVGGIEKVSKLSDKFVFTNAHAGMKMATALHTLARMKLSWAKALQKDPSITIPSDEHMQKEVASFVNNVYGGLDWRKAADEAQTELGKMLSYAAYGPTGRTLLSFAFFAPDWLTSTLRAAAKSLGTGTAIRRMQGTASLEEALYHSGGTGFKGFVNPKTSTDFHRLYQVRNAFYFVLLGSALNFYFSGHSLLDNHKDGVSPLRVSMGDGEYMEFNKHGMEAYTMLEDPKKFFINKLGMLPRETAELMLNKDYLNASGAAPPYSGVMPHLAQNFTPFTFSNMVGKSPRDIALNLAGAPVYGKTFQEKETARKAGAQKAKETRKEHLSKDPLYYYHKREAARERRMRGD